jgi:hypothetical protein
MFYAMFRNFCIAVISLVLFHIVRGTVEGDPGEVRKYRTILDEGTESDDDGDY